MRTSKRLIGCLVLTVITVTAFAAEGELSNTREASCLVRITADPAIIPLKPDVIDGLVLSSGVAGKALREVLGEDFKATDPEAIPILVETLSLTTERKDQAQTFASTLEPRDYEDEMLQELDRIYGAEYLRSYRDSLTAAEEQNEEREQDTPRTSWPVTARSNRGSGRRSGRGLSALGDGPMSTGTRYVDPTTSTGTPRMEQNVTIRLSVHLPEDVRPAARECMNAIVENLRASLQDAYGRYAEDLSNRLAFLESRREDANAQFEDIRTVPSPERELIEAQLQTVIDLSMVSPEMPFSEAIEVLRSSVDPPLNIVVLWRDLLDVAEIEPDQSIHMDGVTNLKVGTALKVLLQAVGGGFARLTYEIREGVIVVGTVDTLLEMSQEPPIVEIDAGALAPRKRELAYEIQGLELQLAGMQARRQAIQEQIARTEVEVERKVAGDEVTQELEEILAMTVRALAQEEGQFASQHPALQRSEAIRELREQVARAKIELAMRREEIARSAGGARLEMFNNDLSQIAIDSAEKQAQLGVLRGQIEETQQELVRASTFDPKAARIRLAREMMNVLDRRVAEQRLRLASLQPPTVTLLGAD